MGGTDLITRPESRYSRDEIQKAKETRTEESEAGGGVAARTEIKSHPTRLIIDTVTPPPLGDGPTGPFTPHPARPQAYRDLGRHTPGCRCSEIR